MTKYGLKYAKKMSASRIEQQTEMAKYSEEMFMVSVVMAVAIIAYTAVSVICWCFSALSNRIRSLDDIV
jgi:uncharacterized membrane protein